MTETPKPWTADQPLRADATDEQIVARLRWNYENVGPCSLTDDAIRVAREFAASCVAAGAEDTRRLDWLEKRLHSIGRTGWGDWLLYVEPMHGATSGNADTVREAVDKGMQRDAARQGEGL